MGEGYAVAKIVIFLVDYIWTQNWQEIEGFKFSTCQSTGD
jgi:hypothetical protein